MLELVVRHVELSSILEDSVLTVEDESLDLIPKLLGEIVRFLDLRNLVLANRDEPLPSITGNVNADEAAEVPSEI